MHLVMPQGCDWFVAIAVDGWHSKSLWLATAGGMLTIIFGHTLLGMAYGMVVIQSAEMDRSIGRPQ
jgi:ABC-type spermidine/putrescine transport system permease subunit II